MVKEYIIKVHVDGHYTVEDPKCPSQWRGSGCYDIDVDTWCDVELEVWAESESSARSLAEEYDYANGYTIDIDDVNITGLQLVNDLPDRDVDEIGVIEPVRIDWKETDYDYD